MHVVATAGHVDHGKSSLLRALTQMEPDRWDEERRRGLTIDLGFVWTDLDGPDGPLTVAFVDVPGHEKFVANMLAGAGAVRLALFVVAADDGWSAQSQEHLDILDLLEVGGAVAAITKTALVDDDRALEVAADVEQRLGATTLAGAPVLLVDSISGDGIDELRTALTQRLVAAPRPRDAARPRLWVDRSFSISGAGTVVTGTLTDGALAAGDEMTLLPQRDPARVRGLQSLGAPVDRAEPGDRVALNLAGLDRSDVVRGDAVVGGSVADWTVTDTLDVWVRALPGCDIGTRGAWHLHLGSADIVVTVHPLLGDDIRGGTAGCVRLVLEHPTVAATGDRFVLREAGRRTTCGGGEILDPLPPGRVRGIDERLRRVGDLEAVRDAPRDDRLGPLVLAHGGAWDAATATAAAGTSVVPEGLRRIGGHLVAVDHLTAWVDAIESAAAAHHEREPTSAGPGRGELATAAVTAGSPAALGPELVDHLAASGALRRAGSSYALPSFAPARDEAREGRRAALLERLDAEPFAPPDLDEAARAVGLGHEELTAVIHDGLVVRCGPMAFTRTAVDTAVTRLRSLQDEVGAFTASQAREALGTTRKYVIPLLEYLDAAGVTTFDGSTRTVR